MINSAATTVRILCLDMLAVVLVSLLVLYGTAQRSPYYLDTALVLAMLGFVGSVAASRYYGEREVF